MKHLAEQTVTTPCKHPLLKGAEFFLSTAAAAVGAETGQPLLGRDGQCPLAGLQPAGQFWDTFIV